MLEDHVFINPEWDKRRVRDILSGFKRIVWREIGDISGVQVYVCVCGVYNCTCMFYRIRELERYR